MHSRRSGVCAKAAAAEGAVELESGRGEAKGLGQGTKNGPWRAWKLG